MLKGPVWFGRIINIIMNIILCTILSLYVLWTVQQANPGLPIFTPLEFFISLITSFCVGYFVGDVFPALAWGNKLANSLHVKNRVVVHFVAILVLALFMITCISFVCTWLNNIRVGFDIVTLSWFKVYPFLLISGYVIELIMIPVCFKIAAAISGFDPSVASPAGAPASANAAAANN